MRFVKCIPPEDKLIFLPSNFLLLLSHNLSHIRIPLNISTQRQRDRTRIVILRRTIY